MPKRSSKRYEDWKWYKKYPDQTWVGFFFHLRKKLKEMWPRARKYGLRYYWDEEFRAQCRKKHLYLMRKQKYGSGFLGNKHSRRVRLIARDGLECVHCHWQTSALEIDHIIPVSEGGTSVDENLQLLCRPCHQEKTNKDLARVAGSHHFKEALSRLSP